MRQNFLRASTFLSQLLCRSCLHPDFNICKSNQKISSLLAVQSCSEGNGFDANLFCFSHVCEDFMSAPLRGLAVVCETVR